MINKKISINWDKEFNKIKKNIKNKNEVDIYKNYSLGELLILYFEYNFKNNAIESEIEKLKEKLKDLNNKNNLLEMEMGLINRKLIGVDKK